MIVSSPLVLQFTVPLDVDNVDIGDGDDDNDDDDVAMMTVIMERYEGDPPSKKILNSSAPLNFLNKKLSRSS